MARKHTRASGRGSRTLPRHSCTKQVRARTHARTHAQARTQPNTTTQYSATRNWPPPRAHLNACLRSWRLEPTKNTVASDGAYSNSKLYRSPSLRSKPPGAAAASPEKTHATADVLAGTPDLGCMYRTLHMSMRRCAGERARPLEARACPVPCRRAARSTPAVGVSLGVDAAYFLGKFRVHFQGHLAQPPQRVASHLRAHDVSGYAGPGHRETGGQEKKKKQTHTDAGTWRIARPVAAATW